MALGNETEVFLSSGGIVAIFVVLIIHCDKIFGVFFEVKGRPQFLLRESPTSTVFTVCDYLHMLFVNG